jgi:TRAP-type C4-dicarboxylate transport system substrate-binding protein
MMAPLQVRLGGYAPKGSTHANGLDRIATELTRELGDRVEVAIDYNILDTGRQIGGLLEDVEAGDTTLCFFSSSYLADRVPELGIVDLPYVFDSLAHAHRLLDGTFGDALTEATERVTGYVVMGYWDNGFRHLSNRLRDVRTPADLAGMSVRLQPNWAHEDLIRELGGDPVRTDLRDGARMLMSGELDAQENPFANFIAYGMATVHPYVSMTGHVYGARGLYASRRQLETWPEEAVAALRRACRVAIEQQRAEAEQKELELRRELEEQGLRILDLTDDEMALFRAAAVPVLAKARERFSPKLWALLEQG